MNDEMAAPPQTPPTPAENGASQESPEASTSPHLPLELPPVPAIPAPAIPAPAIPVPAIPVPAIPAPAIPVPAIPVPAIPIPEIPSFLGSGGSFPTANLDGIFPPVPRPIGPPRPVRSFPPGPPPGMAAVKEASSPNIPSEPIPTISVDLAEPSGDSTPSEEEDEEEFVPLAAMPIIAVMAEEEEIAEPISVEPLPPSSPPQPPLNAAPGIETGTESGWTPAFTSVAEVVQAPAVIPSVPMLPSVDIEELADEDISPESDRPEPLTPPRALLVPSTPPRPPPGLSPTPPRVAVAAPTEEVEVELTVEEIPVDVAVVPSPPQAASPVSFPPGSLSSAPAPLSAPAMPPPPPSVVPLSAPAVPPPTPVVPPPTPVVPPSPPAAPKLVEARPSPKPPADKKRGRPWWEEMFDDDYLRSIKQPTAAQIKAEVDFIDEHLGLREDALILDLACGDGRHTIGLTQRGYRVIGFDLSLAMMARAQEEAELAGQKINFLHGDMRDLNFENKFDGIFLWGMSFGYFDEEKNLAVLQRIYRALRPGGVLLLDICNRDFIAPRQPNMVWFEGDGTICMDETNLDSITSRLKVKRTLMLEDGRTRELDYSIRLYSLHELGKLLRDVGFKVLEVSGQIATPGVFFGSESPRCIVLVERA